MIVVAMLYVVKINKMNDETFSISVTNKIELIYIILLLQSITCDVNIY